MTDEVFQARIRKLRIELEQSRAQFWPQNAELTLLKKQSAQSTEILSFLFGYAVHVLGAGSLHVPEAAFKEYAKRFAYEACPDLARGGFVYRVSLTEKAEANDAKANGGADGVGDVAPDPRPGPTLLGPDGHPIVVRQSDGT